VCFFIEGMLALYRAKIWALTVEKLISPPTASRPESFNQFFMQPNMQLKEMSVSLLALLNMSIHHKVFWFSNTYKRSLSICKLTLSQLIGETFLSPVVAHNTSQPNKIASHFLQTTR
jgi:hypothetical protein